MIITLLLLVCLTGCSPQKSLAKRLKDADRVVVTNRVGGSGLTVTGSDVAKILSAIASGKKETLSLKAAVGNDLEFFKGSQHLETINTSSTVFWVGETPYSDTTGIFQGLAEKFRQENPPQLIP